MILLTGATGTLGRPLLARLLGAGLDLRCLVREPRRLGPARVQVQIAIGNLADHHGVARALRGVDTVVHLGTTSRDQKRGSIERINGLGTSRLVVAAQRAGVRRFVYVCPLGASRYSPSRLIRSRALARDAVAAGRFESMIFESSLIYAPDDRWVGLLRRMAALPAVPVPEPGDARFAPIWSEDAADAITAALLTDHGGPGERVGHHDAATHTHYVELAGPEVFTRDQMLGAMLIAMDRRRPLLRVPRPVADVLLWAQESYLGPSAMVTRDEVALMSTSSLPTRGTVDVDALGVQPLAVADVIGP